MHIFSWLLVLEKKISMIRLSHHPHQVYPTILIRHRIQKTVAVETFQSLALLKNTIKTMLRYSSRWVWPPDQSWYKKELILFGWEERRRPLLFLDDEISHSKSSSGNCSTLLRYLQWNQKWISCWKDYIAILWKHHIFNPWLCYCVSTWQQWDQ